MDKATGLLRMRAADLAGMAMRAPDGEMAFILEANTTVVEMTEERKVVALHTRWLYDGEELQTSEEFEAPRDA